MVASRATSSGQSLGLSQLFCVLYRSGCLSFPAFSLIGLYYCLCFGLIICLYMDSLALLAAIGFPPSTSSPPLATSAGRPSKCSPSLLFRLSRRQSQTSQEFGFGYNKSNVQRYKNVLVVGCFLKIKKRQSFFLCLCGVYRTRTDYLLIANQTLYQMS